VQKEVQTFKKKVVAASFAMVMNKKKMARATTTRMSHPKIPYFGLCIENTNYNVLNSGL